MIVVSFVRILVVLTRERRLLLCFASRAIILECVRVAVCEHQGTKNACSGDEIQSDEKSCQMFLPQTRGNSWR